MSIIITGGCGFIGSNLIKKLLKEGNELIINIDKLTYAGNIHNLDDCKKGNKYVFYHGDISDRNLLLEIFVKFKPRALINCAAETHVDRSITDSNPFIYTNILGTFNLLECSIWYFKNELNGDNSKFRFIQISTDEVFGSLNKIESSFNEKSPYRPSSPYSASKASADHLVSSYFKTHSLPTIIINSSNNYGPNQYPEKLIPLCIHNLIDLHDFYLYGDGMNLREWLYVEDNCRAIIMILNKGSIGESYNVGGGFEVNNKDVVQKICRILDEIAPLKKLENNLSYSNFIKYKKDRPGHDFRYSINSSKIYKELGWIPKVNFDKGLLETIKWYLNNKGWLKKT